jgi:hypothetical protein
MRGFQLFPEFAVKVKIYVPMISKAKTPAQYLTEVQDEWRPSFEKLREVILRNLPSGFEEQMTYGMISFVVPHSLYPEGYHVDPKIPLGFISIAVQKNYIALYHMGIYGNPVLSNWFTDEYVKHCGKKPDMGKSCIRFKKRDKIPFELIAELAGKVSPQAWISWYEKMKAGR